MYITQDIFAWFPICTDQYVTSSTKTINESKSLGPPWPGWLWDWGFAPLEFIHVYFIVNLFTQTGRSSPVPQSTPTVNIQQQNAMGGWDWNRPGTTSTGVTRHRKNYTQGEKHPIMGLLKWKLLYFLFVCGRVQDRVMGWAADQPPQAPPAQSTAPPHTR